METPLIIISIIQLAIFVWVLIKLHYIDKYGQETTARLDTIAEYQKMTTEVLVNTILEKSSEHYEDEDTKSPENPQTKKKVSQSLAKNYQIQKPVYAPKMSTWQS